MPACDNCNAHVTQQFMRVFADPDGTLLACPECAANAGIATAAKQRKA